MVLRQSDVSLFVCVCALLFFVVCTMTAKRLAGELAARAIQGKPEK